MDYSLSLLSEATAVQVGSLCKPSQTLRCMLQIEAELTLVPQAAEAAFKVGGFFIRPLSSLISVRRRI